MHLKEPSLDIASAQAYINAERLRAVKPIIGFFTCMCLSLPIHFILTESGMIISDLIITAANFVFTLQLYSQ